MQERSWVNRVGTGSATRRVGGVWVRREIVMAERESKGRERGRGEREGEGRERERGERGRAERERVVRKGER